LDWINFHKYHGAGNDFIITEDVISNMSTIAKICHRQFGVGSDGLIILRPSKIAEFKIHIFNSDGSEATMCGNGLRCCIKHFGSACSIETPAGICKGIIKDNLIQATLPKAEILESPIHLENEAIGHLVDTGVRHLVIFVEQIHSILMGKWEELRHQFDANVNFALLEENKIFVRSFEKGIEGETLACGTGGAACLLASGQESSEIIFRSGDSAFYHFDEQKTLWMEGSAELVFEGKYKLS